MELLREKGQRSWSVGLSVADLVDSLINDKKKVHSVSVLAKVIPILILSSYFKFFVTSIYQKRCYSHYNRMSSISPAFRVPSGRRQWV